MSHALLSISPQITVRNVKRTADWYRDVLGFKLDVAMPDQRRPAFAIIKRDQVMLLLTDGSDPFEGKAPRAAVRNAVRTRVPQKVVSFYLETSHLAAEHRRVQRAGSQNRDAADQDALGRPRIPRGRSQRYLIHVLQPAPQNR